MDATSADPAAPLPVPPEPWTGSSMPSARSGPPYHMTDMIAAHLGKARHIVAIASGADRVAARELVLKIEEAAWIPSAMRDLETFLHGHLPATGEDTAVVLVLTDRDHRDD